jgi:sulfur carrier protein
VWPEFYRKARNRPGRFAAPWWYLSGMSTPIQVSVNGASREFPAPLTFQQLLEELRLAGKRLAIERNGEIVPRSRFPDAWVADGDRIEVVIAVGGG